MSRSSFVIFWIWLCAGLNCAGWILSAFHQLNATGYAAVLLLGTALSWWWFRQNPPGVHSAAGRHRFVRRFRRGFPLAFFSLGILALLGALWHPPTNYDAMAYRLPRVLNWLAEGHWHWIHTLFPRLNNRSCGFEWVSAPIICLTKSDRFLFLPNIISFFLLPGLCFSVLTRLGVRTRTAWYWMWLAPSGYCYLTQAGSIGNDLFCAAFVLAAVDFALRTRKLPTATHLFTSIIAAGMMTGAKTTSLPLLLPWALTLLPSWRLPFRWPLRFALVCLTAALASVLPTLVMNAIHTGGEDWSGGGLTLKRSAQSFPGEASAVRFVANTGALILNNCFPPPLSGPWNDWMQQNLPASWHRLALQAEIFEPRLADFYLDELPIEENAGFGFGPSGLLLLTVLGAVWAARKATPATVAVDRWRQSVLLSPWFSLVLVMTQSPLAELCRLATPFYALLLPSLLSLSGVSTVIQHRWWRWSAVLMLTGAFALLTVLPARPILPVQAGWQHIAPANERVRMVYQTYHDRYECMIPLRDALDALNQGPCRTFGIAAFDTPETSLWRPFGTRRVYHVCPEDTSVQLKQKGVQFILLSPNMFIEYGTNWDTWNYSTWLKTVHGHIATQVSLTTRASKGPEIWLIAKLD